ncbi:MAG: hypothetical protein HW416_817 [Chloroflexi bacterium]|nr:hypothetical protein [Chloroflexota bacterium]
MATRFASTLGFLVAALVACTPAARPSPSPSGEAGAQPSAEPAGPKILTIAQQTPKEGFGPWFISGPPAPLQWVELHTNFLVTAADSAGNLEAGLAQQLPSLRDGTMEVLPDGRMRTTWKLRPNVKWHDGRPFTVDDVQFGWQVMTHREIATSPSPTVRIIESIDAVDPRTMVMTHSTVYFGVLRLGYRDLYPLPKHLLGEAFGGSKEAFMSLPYFSTEYVHTGPFRLREVSPGDQMVFERFDDYYLGRPKLDRVIIRFIAENNAVVSNLLAGAVDLAGELPTDISARLRDQWQASGGGGYVLSRQALWRFISIQFHPEWGGPPELQRDVRTRAGLAYATDTEGLRAALFPGYPDTEGDTFLLKGDPREPVVGRPFARYRHDPAQALRQFADAGWRRAPDGRMLDAAGKQVRLQLRAPSSDREKEVSIVAQNWREIGFDAEEELVPAALRRDNEHIVKFPGMEVTGQGPEFWNRLDSRGRPTAENRYAGSNAGNYVNPAYDRLIDRLLSTLDDNAAALIVKEMGEIMADDLPGLPLYFAPRTAVALGHVRGVDEIFGAPGNMGTISKNAHQWDRM